MTLAPWKRSPGYLNTASFGVPCQAAVDAVTEATAAWAEGRMQFTKWFGSFERARNSIARLLNVPAHWVALGTASSVFVNSIAASLPDGAKVLAPVNEHNSNLIPYLNQAHRGVSIQLVPLRELASRVSADIGVVSCSAVQSLTGDVLDIEAVRAASAASGSLFCLDASQACGWLPLSGESADVIVCSMYKWLCAPIGGAFFAMRPEVAERFRPAVAGWAAGSDPLAPPYGTEFDLALGARKFDLAPNLVSMAAASVSVDEIIRLGVANIGRHDIALANRFRNGLQLQASNSAIVAVPWEGANTALATAGIRASEWRGNLRVSFHLSSAEADVDEALAVLTQMR
jgi:selenocysteine lyase/cysteine desulfurase